MANLDFQTDTPGPITIVLDPKWLDADETEVAGKDMNGVVYEVSNPKSTVSGDNDAGELVIADPSQFADKEQIFVTVKGDPAPGDDDPIIILEGTITANAPAKKLATHGVLDMAVKV